MTQASVMKQLTSTKFKARLKRLMSAHDMNANQLANAAGINKAAVSRYLNKDYTPTVDTLTRLSHVFGVTLDSWLD